MALPKVGVQLVVEGADAFFSDLKKAQDGIAALGQANPGGGAGFDAIGQAAKGAADDIKRASDTARDSGGGFSALREVGVGALREVGAAAVEAGALVAQSIAAGVASSVQAAGDFEASVNNLAAVSGDALAQAGFSFEDVSAKALQLGQDTRFSASEGIAAMTELVKGGVPIAEVMNQATDATLNLAAAAGVDLGNAAEIVAKQFGVWADTGMDATQISDLLTQAANASTVGVEDLALGLANSGGIAKTIGLDFQELTQTMALLAPGFASSADAGTSLKTFLTSLTPSTKPATEAMAELGLVFTDFKAAAADMGVPLAEGATQMDAQAAVAQHLAQAIGDPTMQSKEFTEAWSGLVEDLGQSNAFYDAAGNFVGMEQAVGTLSQAMAGLTAEQKDAYLSAIFGQDAYRAAAMLAEQGVPGYQAMGEAMAAAGTAAETAAIQNRGWNFAMDSLKGSLETLQIVLGSLLLPILTEFASWFTENVGVVSTFVQAITGSEEAMAALSPSMQSVVEVLQILGGAIGEAGLFSTEFAEALSLVHPSLQPLMLGLNTIVGFLQSNWQPVLAAAGAIIAAALVPAMAAAAAAFGAAVVAAAPVIATLALVGAAAAALKGAWDQNIGGVQEKTASALAAVQGVVQTVLGGILTFWQNNGASILATAQTAWGQIQSIIGTVAAIIAEVVTQVFGGIQAFLSEHGATIQTIATTVWEFISSSITNTLNIIQGIVTTVLGVITGDWDTALNGLKQIADGVLSQINNIFTTGLDLAKTLFSGALDNIKGFFTNFDAASLGSAIIDGIISGVSNGVGALVDAVGNAASAALDAAKSFLGISSPSKVFEGEVGLEISAGIAEGITGGIGQVTSALGGMVTPATEAGKGLVLALKQTGKDAVAGVKDQLSEVGPAATDAVADVPDEMTGMGEDVVAGLVAGLEEGLAAVEAAAQALIDAAMEAAQAAAAISSPSRLFADEVGAPISEGVAEGILDNLDAVISAAGELSAEVIEEAEGLADTIEGTVGDLLSASLQGAADFAKSKLDALDVFEGLMPKTDKLDKLTEKLDKLTRKRNELIDAGAATSDDSRDRMALSRITREREELVTEQAKMRQLIWHQQTLAKEGRQQILEAQQEAATIADPGERAAFLSQAIGGIEKITKARMAVAGAATDEEREMAQLRLSLIEEQVKAEAAVYADQAKARQREREEQLREVADAMGQLTDLVADSTEGMSEAGADAIRGLGQGMLAELDRLSASLGGEMGNLLAAIKAALGIASPSKLFAAEIGGPLAQGIGAGFLAGLKSVTAQAASAVAGMASGVAASVVRPAAPAWAMAGAGGVNSSTVNNFNYQPRYEGAPRQPSQDFAVMRSLHQGGL